MNRLRIAVLLSLVLALVLAGTIFADIQVVKYDDSNLEGYEANAGGSGAVLRTQGGGVGRRGRGRTAHR